MALSSAMGLSYWSDVLVDTHICSPKLEINAHLAQLLQLQIETFDQVKQTLCYLQA